MKFTPRLTEPSENNKNYIHYTHGGYNTAIVIDKDTGSVLPNCVGYAQGRLLELIGKNKVDWKLPACNAEDWFETAQKNGFKTGQIPKLGAIAVFRAGTTHNGSDGAGHVVVVEEIKANGDIVVSQSAYGGAKFYTTLLTKESGYKYADYRIFEGFIYCPVEFEQAAETPTPDVIEAGKKITLDNTDCYTSETSTSSYSRKTGTYYLWDDVVKNGRIRITRLYDVYIEAGATSLSNTNITDSRTYAKGIVDTPTINYRRYDTVQTGYASGQSYFEIPASYNFTPATILQVYSNGLLCQPTDYTIQVNEVQGTYIIVFNVARELNCVLSFIMIN